MKRLLLYVICVFSTAAQAQQAVPCGLRSSGNYTAVTTMFSSKYGGLAGDFNKATTYWGPTVVNGNGDGVISPSEQAHVCNHLVAAGYLEPDWATPKKK